MLDCKVFFYSGLCVFVWVCVCWIFHWTLLRWSKEHNFQIKSKILNEHQDYIDDKQKLCSIWQSFINYATQKMEIFKTHPLHLLTLMWILMTIRSFCRLVLQLLNVSTVVVIEVCFDSVSLRLYAEWQIYTHTLAVLFFVWNVCRATLWPPLLRYK